LITDQKLATSEENISFLSPMSTLTLNETIREHFLTSLLSGNRMSGSKLIHDLLKEGVGIYDVYEWVIKETLYRVGELWEQNRITVAEEHLATSVAEAIMNEFFADIVSKDRKQRKVLVGCVEHELHQVGAKMVADVFEMKGWDSYFLGTGIPLEELIRFARELKPDVIAISISIYFHLPQLDAMLARIAEELPDMPMLVGGQAFRHGGTDVVAKYDRVTFIANLYELETFVDQYEVPWTKNLS
jgi:methanogenic corrinoid protein MtbC1